MHLVFEVQKLKLLPYIVQHSLHLCVSFHQDLPVAGYWFILKIRRRRWLIRAQGSSAARTLGSKEKRTSTLKGFTARRTLSGLQENLWDFPGLSLRSNPGLELANAFGVFSNWARISQRLRRIFRSALKLNQYAVAGGVLI